MSFNSAAESVRKALQGYEKHVEALRAKVGLLDAEDKGPFEEIVGQTVEKEALTALAAELLKVKEAAEQMDAALKSRREEIVRRRETLGQGTAVQEAESRALEQELASLRRCHELPGVLSEKELLARDPKAAALPRRKRLLGRIRLALEEQAASARDVEKEEARLAQAKAAAGWGDDVMLSADAKAKVTAAEQSGSAVASLQGMSFRQDANACVLRELARLPRELALVASNLHAIRAAYSGSDLKMTVETNDGSTDGGRKRAAGSDKTKGQATVTLRMVSKLSLGSLMG
eukprot:Hpha_TRINITY_DN3164_c0_g1::TRINITY_DN3164_c0_g1_i1::g.96490::m.96490